MSDFEQRKKLHDELYKSRVGGFRPFPTAPDGATYDHKDFQVRYGLVYYGYPMYIISKMWLDKGGPVDCPPELLVQWGTYPEPPPKPKKK
jgi:hypothetical protein